MYNSADILEELLGVEVSYDTPLYIYSLHMGGISISEIEEDISTLYCETCGDSDVEIDSGLYGDLIKRYAQDLVNDRQQISAISYILTNNININGIINDISGIKCKGEDTNKYISCDKLIKEDSCIIGKNIDIISVAKNESIPYECKACFIDNRLDDLLC